MKLVLALTSRLSPRPSQFGQDEPHPTESSSSDDDPKVQQLDFSIVIEDCADEDLDFQRAPSRLPMPLEIEEQTGRSIEIGRRALDDRKVEGISRGSFGTVRANHRFDSLSALGFNDVSQPPFDDSAMPILPNADEEDLGDSRENSRPESVVV